jgi:hypothetical protein
VAHVLRLTLTNDKQERIVLPGGNIDPQALLREFLIGTGQFESETGWQRVEGDGEKYVQRSTVVSVELVEEGRPSVSVLG